MPVEDALALAVRPWRLFTPGLAESKDSTLRRVAAAVIQTNAKIGKAREEGRTKHTFRHHTFDNGHNCWVDEGGCAIEDGRRASMVADDRWQV